MGIVASETVRRCFEIFLAFRGVEARDSTIWRRVAQDLKGGRGERTYPSLHPSTSNGYRRCLLGMYSRRDHCVIRIQMIKIRDDQTQSGYAERDQETREEWGGGWLEGGRER